jgi:hypothetical protein
MRLPNGFAQQPLPLESRRLLEACSEGNHVARIERPSEQNVEMIGHKTPRVKLKKVPASQIAEPLHQLFGRIRGGEDGVSLSRAERQEEESAPPITPTLKAYAFSFERHLRMIADSGDAAADGFVAAVFRPPAIVAATPMAH